MLIPLELDDDLACFEDFDLSLDNDVEQVAIFSFIEQCLASLDVN